MSEAEKQNVEQTSCFGTQNQADDNTVQGEGFAEDKNQKHANEQLWLSSICTNASIANDTDSNTSSEGTEANTQTTREMGE